MNVLLLGAGGNAGINFTKCLHMEEGTTVIGVDVNKYNLASCNADIKIFMEKLLDDEKIKFLNDMIGIHGIDLVHAQPDIEMSFLLGYGDQLNAKIFKHSCKQWNLFRDKMLCQKAWANEFDYTYPMSLETALQNDHQFKHLAKANGKVWIRAKAGAGSRAALPVTSIDHAWAWARYWMVKENMNIKDFMLNEFLPGKEYAVQTFWHEGEPIHAQARERVEYIFGNIMPSGQSSTPSVARVVDDIAVYKRAHDAIRVLDDRPHGIYCVDMKTASNGAIVPTEINYGRFYTTTDFFATIGINTPHLYCQNIMGHQPTTEDIKVNTLDSKYVWLRGLDREPVLIEEN